MQNDPGPIYYIIRLNLLREGGLKNGLGPFTKEDGKSGLLVRYLGSNYSAYIVVGTTHIKPGDTADVRLIMAIPILKPSDEIELFDGNRLVGSASVLSMNVEDLGKESV